MLRILAAVLVPVLLVASPAEAVTSQEKMQTCKVGAESQQRKGARGDASIKKGMGGGIYDPPARKTPAKQTPPNPKYPASSASPALSRRARCRALQRAYFEAAQCASPQNID